MPNYLLSLIIFLPLVFIPFVLALPASQKKWTKWITLGVCSLQLVLVVWLHFHLLRLQASQNTPSEGLLIFEKAEWIRLALGNYGVLSIDYFVGVDGLSWAMLLLSALVMWIGAIASWEIESQTKGYFTLYLLLACSIPGCFVALDFFLFYLFFEFMLLPMYFLIGIWGGERREYASIKFFIYTFFGSLFILLSIIGLYLSVIDPEKTAYETGLVPAEKQVTKADVALIQTKLAKNEIILQKQVHSFNILQATNPQNYRPGSLLQPVAEKSTQGFGWRWWAFWAMVLGFAVKLPMVPFHTWLPDAHVEAPTPVSVVLAGILLKIGGYGMMRLAFSCFGDVALQNTWPLGLMAIISILYGALNALAMSDLKKMVAYSSVSHMGFVLLGIASLTTEGWSGAIFQMFSHGVLSAMLFFVVGVLYSRTHDRQIEHYRGLLSEMPYFSSFVFVAFFASLGLPGFSGFIGELFTLVGAFKSKYLPVWMPILGALGIVLGASYFLWALQRMFFGKFWLKQGQDQIIELPDLNYREWLVLTILALLTLALGVFPSVIFQTSTYTINQWIQALGW